MSPQDFFHKMLDFVGYLLFCFLRLIGYGAPSKGYEKQRVQRLLILRTDRIGDLVLSTPAIATLRDHFPEASISCLVSLYAKDVVLGHPALDEVIVYDRRILKKPFKLLRFLSELRKKRFDMAVVLNYTPDAILLAYLSGAPVRVGTRIPGLGWFLTQSIGYRERDRFGRHEIECVLDVLRKIGIEPFRKELSVSVSEKGELFATHFFGHNDLEGEKVVAIHPGSRQPRMRWKKGGFIEVIDALREEGVRILLIGGPAEEDLVDAIARTVRGPVMATPPGMTLTELISLLKRCSLFIGHGTGTMHIAAALNIPVIAIFADGSPMDSHEKWGHRGPQQIIVELPQKSFETFDGEAYSGAQTIIGAAKKLLGVGLHDKTAK